MKTPKRAIGRKASQSRELVKKWQRTTQPLLGTWFTRVQKKIALIVRLPWNLIWHFFFLLLSAFAHFVPPSSAPAFNIHFVELHCFDVFIFQSFPSFFFFAVATVALLKSNMCKEIIYLIATTFSFFLSHSIFLYLCTQIGI